MELFSTNIKVFTFPEMKPCTSQPKPQKNPKKLFTFPEMENSSSNIKKILILSQKKAFLIFSQNKAFLIFPEMEPCTFQSKL